MLPPSAGITGHANLLIAGGKQGKLYLIDRGNMGKFDPNNDNVVNAVPDGSGHNTPPVAVTGDLSTPAYYNGKIYMVSGYIERLVEQGRLVRLLQEWSPALPGLTLYYPDRRRASAKLRALIDFLKAEAVRAPSFRF